MGVSYSSASSSASPAESATNSPAIATADPSVNANANANANAPDSSAASSPSHSPPPPSSASNSVPSCLFTLPSNFSSLELSQSIFLTSPPAGSEFLSDGKPFDLLTYADHARAMLSEHPQLSLWRYKLVPARISEFQFWRNFFYHLEQQKKGSENHQTHQQSQVEASPAPAAHSRPVGARVVIPASASIPVNSTPRQANPAPSPTSAASAQSSLGPVETLDTLSALNKKLQEELAKSQAQVKSLKAEVEALKSQQTAQPNSSAPTAQPSDGSSHPGQWIIDPTAKEFFAFDAQLKDNLRREKAKKLAETAAQLKWIIDTDRESDAPGQWSCCKASQHTAKGCKLAK